MQAQGISGMHAWHRLWSRLAVCLATVLAMFCPAPSFQLHAGPLANADSPVGFFTNVAAPLLKAQLGLDLTNIQVFPTNYYSPAVHRILQVTANLYDATTNRAYATNSVEPFCPTVFRPLFRRTPDSTIIIAGFREVQGTAMASAMTAPAMLQPDASVNDASLVPSLGTPFFASEQAEPMLSGVPLVVGAKKGFPNFNEFAMQASISVSRLLEFRRASGSTTGPVVQTNQLFVAAISNVFGIEIWNSYTNPYPRNLQVIASANMLAMVTNELGNVLVSNVVPAGTISNLASGSLAGWHSLGDLAGSFTLPWGTGNNLLFLTNSAYVDGTPPFFGPQTHTFQRGIGFNQPHFYLNLNTRLLFILVDTDANRIVDYVNLNFWEPSIDIMGKLAEGADCSGIPASLTSQASQWCTNLTGGTKGPPMGVVNQISLGLGLNGATLPDIASFSVDPYSGLDAQSAVDAFRYNLMGWGPIYPKDQGKTFYKSNVFYVPFDPYGPLYVHTSLQANDPLVHYTFGDLFDLSAGPTNHVNLLPHYPPLENLGQINIRFQPWGGGPFGPANPSMPPRQIAAKDPMVTRPDAWAFPTNQPLSIGWVGQVHRGTPWQTIFLKSPNILLQTPSVYQNFVTWQIWTGNSWVWATWPGGNGMVPDAFFTLPTNDWRMVTQLACLFNTNTPYALASANQTSIAGWTSLLDGLTVFTNPVWGELDPLVMSADSPQAGVIAAGLLAARSSQPSQVFLDPSAILATSELSAASPWLNVSNTPTDLAVEMVPAQLLGKLRPDSIGSLGQNGGPLHFQFTGFDGYPYAVQVSSNLVDWTTVTTNYPSNGVFSVTDTIGLNPPNRFYRSALLP